MYFFTLPSNRIWAVYTLQYIYFYLQIVILWGKIYIHFLDNIALKSVASYNLAEKKKGK